MNYSHAGVKDEVEGGAGVRRSWDQPDSGNLGLTWQRNDWTLTLTGSYHTGWPTTRIFLQSGSDSNGDPAAVAVIGKRNGIRFSHYLSLDVKAIREVPLSHGKLRLEFGVTNLLNRNNQAGVDYVIQQDDTGATMLIGQKKYAIPIAPLVDIFWVF